MNRIIVYGAGRMFWDNISKFDIHEVVCIADKQVFMTPLFGCQIIRPERILEFDFDYIVVFSKYDCDVIRNELITLGVNASKIVSWSYYLYVMVYRLKNITEGARNGREDIRIDIRNWFSSKTSKQKVLDINYSFVCNSFQRIDCGITDFITHIDNLVLDKRALINKADYRKNIENINNGDFYDVITCFDFFLNHSYDEFIALYRTTYNKSKYIMLSLPYNGFSSEKADWNNFCIPDGDIVYEKKLSFIRLLVVEKKINIRASDARIYVVTHKKFLPPTDDLYKPIFAGSDNNNVMNIQGDKEEDNISDLNPLINECTVLYWIWKHSSEEYVGLNHYRRYFSIENDAGLNGILNYCELRKEIDDVDMLVAPIYDSFPYSLKYQLECSVENEIFKMGWETVRGVLAKKYPEYLEDFDDYFDGHYMYPCNMFITRREVLNTYCKWLFDILIESCNLIQMKACDSYSSRIVGFIAERLLGLWIFHNNTKIKEINMVLINEGE